MPCIIGCESRLTQHVKRVSIAFAYKSFAPFSRRFDRRSKDELIRNPSDCLCDNHSDHGLSESFYDASKCVCDIADICFFQNLAGQ